jgi:integrase
MKAKPALVARVNDGSGKFPRIPVQIRRRAIVFPLERQDGTLFLPPDVIGYYARYNLDRKPHIKALGKDPVAALTQFIKIESDVERQRRGLEPIHQSKSKPDESEAVAPEDRSLRTLAAQFKANLVILGKKRATIAGYSRAVDDLAKQYPNKSIDEITKQEMLDHICFLRTKIKTRTGDTKHTFRNRLRNLTVFFNACQAKNPLAMRDLPKPMKARPNRYSIAVINKMLAVASEQEKDLIHFFLNTGFRDEEVAFSKYSDIDFEQGSINAHAKPEYNWTPKDSEFREQDIVLQPKFVERMKARMERTNRKSSDLIFPQKAQEKPDMNLIKIVKRVADRAGIVGKPITLHGFRRTFGSIVQKQYGLEQARIWLGHSDIETTQRYIAAEEFTTEQSRQKATEMFAGIQD